MNLKNYTSTTPASASISRIEKKIVAMGANHISKQYDGGALSGISFKIKVGATDVDFQLPANVHGVYHEMKKSVKRPREGTEQRIVEQAERTAWKLIADWVDCQASMIYLQQVEVMQVFLPFALMPGGKSVFNTLKSGDWKALKPGE